MTEEDYKELCESEEVEDYAYEHEFKRDGMVAFLDILGYANLAKTASERVIFDVMSAEVIAKPSSVEHSGDSVA